MKITIEQYLREKISLNSLDVISEALKDLEGLSPEQRLNKLNKLRGDTEEIVNDLLKDTSKLIILQENVLNEVLNEINNIDVTILQRKLPPKFRK